jgi:hypothetical protein
MNEATNLISNLSDLSLSGLSSSGTGTVSNLYSGTGLSGYSGTPYNTTTTTTPGNGLTLVGNSTIHYEPIQTNKMTPKQVNVAVFTITRDEDTNEINSTKFLKQLWIEQKNGTSIDLLVAKQLGNDFDPETTVIKVLSTVSF